MDCVLAVMKQSHIYDLENEGGLENILKILKLTEKSKDEAKLS